MALEAASYLDDISYNLGSAGAEINVSGIFSKEFDRKSDIEATIGYEVKKYESFESIEKSSDKKYLICIGSNVAIYRYLVELIRPRKLQLLSLIHPTAYVAKTAQISDGVILAPNTFVGACAKIGSGTIVNVGSTVGHDCTIGEACVISPNVSINGSVEVGVGAFFGSKTSVDPGIKIGMFSKTVSGSSVRKDLQDGHLFLSNPERSVKMFSVENGRSLFSKSNNRVEF